MKSTEPSTPRRVRLICSASDYSVCASEVHRVEMTVLNRLHEVAVMVRPLPHPQGCRATGHHVVQFRGRVALTFDPVPGIVV